MPGKVRALGLVVFAAVAALSVWLLLDLAKVCRSSLSCSTKNQTYSGACLGFRPAFVLSEGHP